MTGFILQLNDQSPAPSKFAPTTFLGPRGSFVLTLKEAKVFESVSDLLLALDERTTRWGFKPLSRADTNLRIVRVRQTLSLTYDGEVS